MTVELDKVLAAIEVNENEIDHLQEELRNLQSVEEDTPRESYQRQRQQILTFIAREQRKLEENRRLEHNYKSAKENILQLRALRDLYDVERDSQIRREINEEIDARTIEVQKSISYLTEELGKEVRDYFINLENETAKSADEEILEVSDSQEIEPVEEDNKNQSDEIDGENDIVEVPMEHDKKEVTDKKEDTAEESYDETKTVTLQDEQIKKITEQLELARKEYEEASAKHQKSINEFQRIFAEENERLTNGDLFLTTQELDEFTKRYMRLKIMENERFLAAKKEMEQAENRIALLEKTLESMKKITEKGVEITEDDFSEINAILAKQGVKKVLLEKEGLEDLASKKEKLTSDEKARIEETLHQVAAKIQKERKEKDVSVLEAINAIYDTTFKYNKSGAVIQSRKAKITPAAKEKMQEKADSMIRKVGGVENEDKVPVKGPDGVPVNATSLEEQQNPPIERFVTIPKERPAIKLTVPKKNESVHEKTGSDIIPGFTTPQERPVIALKAPTVNQEALYKPSIEGFAPVEKRGEIILTSPTTNEQALEDTAGTVIDKFTTKVDRPKIMLSKPKLVENPILKRPLIALPGKLTMIDPDYEVLGTRVENSSRRTFDTIISELVGNMKKPDGELRPTNIQVSDSFNKELKEGTVLYNIEHYVPEVEQLPTKVARNLAGSFDENERATLTLRTLKKRIDALPEEDLEIIFDRYKDDQEIQGAYPTVLTTLIDNKMQEYALGKLRDIEVAIDQRQQQVLSAYIKAERVNYLVSKENLSEDEYYRLMEYRERILSGQTENIRSIYECYNSVGKWLNTGSKRFAEKVKNEALALPCIGAKIAEDASNDQELQQRKTQLQNATLAAVTSGDNAASLSAFIEYSKLSELPPEMVPEKLSDEHLDDMYKTPFAKQIEMSETAFAQEAYLAIIATSAVMESKEALANVAEEDLEIYRKAIRRIESNLADYCNGRATSEEIYEKMQNYAKHTRRSLVQVVETFNREMMQYADDHLEIDAEETRKAVDELVCHPDVALKFQLAQSSGLKDEQVAEQIENKKLLPLLDVPREMRDKVIYATAATAVVEGSMSLMKASNTNERELEETLEASQAAIEQSRGKVR